MSVTKAVSGSTTTCKIVTTVTKAAGGTVLIVLAGVTGAIMFADYVSKFESELLDEHIDVVQDVKSNISLLLYNDDLVVEIATIYNLNDLHLSSTPGMSSYYYSNYYMVSRVYSKSEYRLYEDFKDYTSQQTNDSEYYNMHYFAGSIQLTTSSTTLSNNMQEMLKLKQSYDKQNHINNWPFNWLD